MFFCFYYFNKKKDHFITWIKVKKREQEYEERSTAIIWASVSVSNQNDVNDIIMCYNCFVKWFLFYFHIVWFSVRHYPISSLLFDLNTIIISWLLSTNSWKCQNTLIWTALVHILFSSPILCTPFCLSFSWNILFVNLEFLNWKNQSQVLHFFDAH